MVMDDAEEVIMKDQARRPIGWYGNSCYGVNKKICWYGGNMVFCCYGITRKIRLLWHHYEDKVAIRTLEQVVYSKDRIVFLHLVAMVPL